VRDVAEVEWYQRKIEMTKYFSRCPETIHDYPVKVACLALIPATTFMIFFQFFIFGSTCYMQRPPPGYTFHL